MRTQLNPDAPPTRDQATDGRVSSEPVPTTLGPVARILDALVRAYQWLYAGRISPCRYVPSCSTYAREALAAHGAVRGSWYALTRLGRCHPWGGHGYDPVPGTAPGTPPSTDA